MKARITLQLDEEVIANAKEQARLQNISLSKLVERQLIRLTTAQYKSIEDMPVSDWVSVVSDGEMQYVPKPKTRKQLKDEYYNSKK